MSLKVGDRVNVTSYKHTSGKVVKDVGPAEVTDVWYTGEFSFEADRRFGPDDQKCGTVLAWELEEGLSAWEPLAEEKDADPRQPGHTDTEAALLQLLEEALEKLADLEAAERPITINVNITFGDQCVFGSDMTHDSAFDKDGSDD